MDKGYLEVLGKKLETRNEIEQFYLSCFHTSLGARYREIVVLNILLDIRESLEQKKGEENDISS